MSSIRAGMAAAITGGGPGQALTAAGMTDTVKAAVLEMTANVTLGTAVAPYQYGAGMTDGTTQRAYAVLHESGIIPALNDAEGRFDTATVIQHTTTGNNGLDAEASHVSFGAGTHNITWGDLPTAAHQIKYVLFGGDDIDVAVIELTGSASINGTASVTGLPFAPNFVHAIGWSLAFSADGTFSILRTTTGYAVWTAAGATEQVCVIDFATDRTDPIACRTALRDDCFAGRMTAAADSSRLSLQSWNSDGVTVETLNAAFAQTVVLLLVRFRKNNLRAFIPSLVTSSTGNKEITGIGFRTKAYAMLATDLAAKNSSATDATTSKWSHGIHTGFETALVGVQAEDGVAGAGLSDSRSIGSSSSIAHVLDDAGGDSWRASPVSTAYDTITINVDDASSADRVAAVVAFSEDFGEPGWLPATRRFRRQLARM